MSDYEKGLIATIETMKKHNEQLSKQVAELQKPRPMVLTCPFCGGRHIDEGEFVTKPHHTHACQHCGMVWRPCIEPTVGVQFLPGFKNEQIVFTDEEKQSILGARMIEAIKSVRARLGIPLKDAKDYVDEHAHEVRRP